MFCRRWQAQMGTYCMLLVTGKARKDRSTLQWQKAYRCSPRDRQENCLEKDTKELPGEINNIVYLDYSGGLYKHINVSSKCICKIDIFLYVDYTFKFSSKFKSQRKEGGGGREKEEAAEERKTDRDRHIEETGNKGWVGREDVSFIVFPNEVIRWSNSKLTVDFTMQDSEAELSPEIELSSEVESFAVQQINTLSIFFSLSALFSA